jgi:cephalosporin hydroxylase
MAYAIIQVDNMQVVQICDADPGQPAVGHSVFKVDDVYAVPFIKNNRDSKFFLYTQYPAIMTPQHVLQYREVLQMVPAGGKIVEIGSFCGGSAAIALEMISADTQLYCIDAGWMFDQRNLDAGMTRRMDPQSHWDNHIDLNHRVSDHDSRLSFARHYLAGYSNVTLIPGASPDSASDWQHVIDLYFEDGDHTNPTLRRNLDFWVSHVRSGGIIAGHDYNNADCPDVNAEAHALAARLGTELHHGDGPGSIWWMRKP